jgi:uncharacterized membrane protein
MSVTNWVFISQKTAFFIVTAVKLRSYIALIGWALQQRNNVYPVRYELGFYIAEDTILHSHRRESLKSYTEITGWAL